MSNNFKDFLNSSYFTEEEKDNMEKTAESLVSKYAHMTNDELNKALMNEVAKQKANGTFDKEKLFAMLESVKSMLPNDTYNNMKMMLSQL